jgi:hypothetical protein
MRVYGKVKSTFWTRTKRLSDRGKLLAVYLLSCPHGSTSGCFYLPPAYIMGDLGWVSETVTDTLAELSRNGFAYHCERSDWVLMPNFIKHNPPENGNVGKRLAVEASAIPDDFTYLPEFIAALKPYAERLPKGFIKELETVRQTNPERYANPTPLPTTPNHTNPDTEDVTHSGRGATESEPAEPTEPGGGFLEVEGTAEPDPTVPGPDEDMSLGDLPEYKPAERWTLLGPELLEITRLDEKPRPVTYGIVRQWLADWTEADILAAVQDVIDGENYDPHSISNLKYFEPAIRRRVDQRNAELNAEIADRCALISDTVWRKIVAKWRAGEYDWDASYHGPAPDQRGFNGPSDVAGPRDIAPGPAPRRQSNVTSFPDAAARQA